MTKVKNDGVSMNITYDAMGNSTGTSLAADSGGKQIKTAAAYTGDGSLLASQTDSGGYTTNYTFDAQRNLLISKDNAGTLTNTNYYDQNNRPALTFQSGVISTHFYYSCGMLTSVVRGGYIPGNSAKQNQTYSMQANTSRYRPGAEGFPPLRVFRHRQTAAGAAVCFRCFRALNIRAGMFP